MTKAADEFHRVSDTLFHWSLYDPSVKCELSCTALRVASGFVVFDPVPLADSAWEELLGDASLRAIILTNGNHPRAAAHLRRQHQVPLVTAVETRRDFIDLKPDVTLLPNELLYGISAIAIPGATPGETAFYSQSGVMVLGDAVINLNSETGLQLLPDKYCSDAAQNRASLRRLLDYPFHTLTFAHGAPVTAHAREKLQALLASSP